MIVPFFTALNSLTAPFTSTDKPLVNKGSNGDYSYELWHGIDNRGYYLKIWKDGTYPKGEKPKVAGSFNSAKEAYDYLNKNYT
jgi:hypothetical protein